MTFLPCPILSPKPLCWSEHGQGVLGQLQPWPGSVWWWHWVWGLFWDWDSAPGLASTVNPPVPITVVALPIQRGVATPSSC